MDWLQLSRQIAKLHTTMDATWKGFFVIQLGRNQLFDGGVIGILLKPWKYFRIFLVGQQIGFISNGRDAADRIREEGWRAEFTTRKDARHRATEPLANDRLRPVLVETRKGPEKFRQILETLARLEHTDGLEFSEMLAATVSQIPRDATVVPVLRQVTPEIAIALGGLVRRGFLVTAVVVAFEREPIPDWAQPPEWAGLLLAQGTDFRIVNSEESVMNLCAEAIVR